MNIRTALGFDKGYYTINREERNLAAIFYHLLLQKDNLSRFLNLTKCPFPVLEDEVAIYFEFAFLRDLWFNIDSQANDNDNRNARKRNVILDLLNPSNREELKSMSVLNFNTYFGAVPKPSPVYIQSPGNWSIPFYNSNIKDNDEFLKVCKFKWCFNAKPDIVIHTTNEHAICIEAKLESKEGKYPSSEKERKLFFERGFQELVGQLEIQKKIIDDLLGIQAQYIFLISEKTSSSDSDTLTWREVFKNLDTSQCPKFIVEWIKRIG